VRKLRFHLNKLQREKLSGGQSSAQRRRLRKRSETIRALFSFLKLDRQAKHGYRKDSRAAISEIL